MYDIQGGKTSDILNRQAGGNGRFQRADLREVTSNQEPLIEAPSNEVKELNPQLLLVPIGFLVIALAVRFINRSHFREPGDNKLDTIERCTQIPCSSCRFFKNEFYLKCAVHPLKVSSADASDCPDYWPLDSNKFYSSSHRGQDRFNS
jgi:hypothetical protein